MPSESRPIATYRKAVYVRQSRRNPASHLTPIRSVGGIWPVTNLARLWITYQRLYSSTLRIRPKANGSTSSRNVFIARKAADHQIKTATTTSIRKHTRENNLGVR